MTKYTFNKNFFDIIDTQEKAYVLGLFYADACNIGYRLTLSLIDRDLLESVRDVMNGNHDILGGKKRAPTRSPVYTLNLFSRSMCERLTEIGCPPQKTMKLTFPSDIIPNELKRHFIRGYFDGDGSVWVQIHKKQYKYVQVSIVGNESFLEPIQKIIGGKVWVREGKIPELKINDKIGVERFRRYIYDDATIYLKRKYDKFLSLQSAEPLFPFDLS